MNPSVKKLATAALLGLACVAAHADAVQTLKTFVQDVKTGRAAFTQTVQSQDGAKKASSGSFEFSRPNRFRFSYNKPFEQLIVSDGQKIWIHDKDLNQVSARAYSKAIGTTPAALLAGGDLERDFTLAAQPARDGLEWVEALPKVKDGSFERMRVGFRGKDLASVEIIDNFGQRSLLQFSQLAANVAITPETFRFTPPKGADVIEQ